MKKSNATKSTKKTEPVYVVSWRFLDPEEVYVLNVWSNGMFGLYFAAPKASPLHEYRNLDTYIAEFKTEAGAIARSKKFAKEYAQWQREQKAKHAKWLKEQKNAK